MLLGHCAYIGILVSGGMPAGADRIRASLGALLLHQLLLLDADAFILRGSEAPRTTAASSW